MVKFIENLDEKLFFIRIDKELLYERRKTVNLDKISEQLTFIQTQNDRYLSLHARKRNLRDFVMKPSQQIYKCITSLV